MVIIRELLVVPFFLLRLVLLTNVPVTVEALASGSVPSSSTTTGSLPIASKLINTECTLQLSVGRIPGTAMPPEWAASGATLVLPNLVLQFTDELCDYEMTKERLLAGSAKKDTSHKNNYLSVAPLSKPSFITMQGKQEVEVTGGAYNFDLQRIDALRYGLRFFLDFPEGAQRNDVTLPAERIYFLVTCWIKNETSIANAEQLKKEIEEKLLTVKKEMVELNESTKNNFFKKALSMRPSILLAEKRQLLQDQIIEIRQAFPLSTTKDSVVDGPNDTLFAKEGFMSVKRYAGALGSREQYHWIGKFTLKDFDVVAKQPIPAPTLEG